VDLGVEAPCLRGSGVAVVPVQVGVDRGVLLGMAGMVGAIEREATQCLELALDQVEPARIGGQVHQLDVALGDPGTDFSLTHVLVPRMWPYIRPLPGS
jgi:hypothetical protein